MRWLRSTHVALRERAGEDDALCDDGALTPLNGGPVDDVAAEDELALEEFQQVDGRERALDRHLRIERDHRTADVVLLEGRKHLAQHGDTLRTAKAAIHDVVPSPYGDLIRCERLIEVEDCNLLGPLRLRPTLAHTPIGTRVHCAAAKAFQRHLDALLGSGASRTDGS